MRRLWISRINAALSAEKISYSQFIHQLKKANIELNRKILADLAVNDPSTFTLVIKKAQ